MINATGLIEILKSKKEDLSFINFQQKIINTKLKVLGVKVPVLRKFAKEVIKNNEQIEFNKQTDEYFECVLLEGLIIAEENDKNKLKAKLNQFFEKIDNWAVVDTVVLSLIAFKKNSTEDDFKYLENLLFSEKTFVVRFGVVCLLRFFTDNNHYEKVLSAIKNVKCEEYYVNMAVAWLLSEIIIKNTQNVNKIVENIKFINNLNKFVVNKCIQKVCDSYRVSNEIKEFLKQERIK